MALLLVVAVEVVVGEEGMKVPWPRIHCGSVVMSSPGTRMRLEWEEDSLRRLVGRRGVVVALGSDSESSAEEVGEGDGGLSSSSESEGGRMVMAMVVEDRDW